MICENCIHNEVCTYGENRSNGLYCTGNKCRQFKDRNLVIELPVKVGTDISERWEKNLKHLMSGGFGDPIHAETLLNYWMAQADAGYPGARENVKYFEEMVGIEKKELGMPPWCKFCKHGYHIFEKGENYIHCNLSYLGYPVKKDPQDTCEDFESEDTE